MATLEQKKAEAIARMKLLGIFPETIKQFEKEGKVSFSEPPLYAFYWANEEQQKVIKEFEKEHNALVYMGIRSYTTYGICDSYFYVSDYEEEWELDKESLTNKENPNQVVYVYNNDDPWCSELGSIGFEKTPAGSLKRTW